jgi:hypothetical protein
MDLLLTGHDMDITNGELSFVRAGIAIAQDIKMAFRTFLGETVYDTSTGVPYTQVMFVRGTSIDAVKLILERIALGRPGVLGASLIPVLDSQTRELSVTGTIQTLNEEIDFSDILGITA